MSIRKEIIKNNGTDMNIRITISSHDNFIGYQQEIDNLTQVTATDLANPVIDSEERKFKLDSSVIPPTLYFYFNGYNSPSFIGAGFTQDEINKNTENIQKSFYILDFYDTYDVYTQSKIFTTYLTKVGYSPVYIVNQDTNNQIYYWYIPISYIESQTGSTSIAYVKFTFYNAKSGTTTQFYNNNNSNLLTPEKLYFKLQFDLVNKTWKFINPNNGMIIAKDLNNLQYNNRINNTFATQTNKTQVYPTGNTYNYKENNYLIND